jgi:glycosyltransferase involved in cell wall biosynthesis
VADHLRHDENGLAYHPGDVEAMAEAMVALVDDPARRTRLAAGARQTAEQLSWEEELDRLSQSYRDRVPGVSLDARRSAAVATPAA